jgi:hypothetical protein
MGEEHDGTGCCAMVPLRQLREAAELDAMRKFALVVVVVGAYFGWVSFPEFNEPAEMTESCTFPTISNEKYRTFVLQARALIDPRRRDIWVETRKNKSLGHGYTNEVLSDLAKTFLGASKTAEETLVRYHAFGRALGGRAHKSAPTQGIVGAEIGFIIIGPDGLIAEPPLRLSGSFQLGPGTFRRGWLDWILGRTFGRRYDRVGIRALYQHRPLGSDANDTLVGTALMRVDTTLRELADPLDSIAWGDYYVSNDCPDTKEALNRYARRLAERQN